MVKLNSTTAILSDLDGVILDLSYDIKFWELWLPEHVADQTNQSIEEAQKKIQAEIDAQRGTLNFYDLNYYFKKNSSRNDWLFVDGVHCNDNGYKLTAKFISG